MSKNIIIYAKINVKKVKTMGYICLVIFLCALYNSTIDVCKRFTSKHLSCKMDSSDKKYKKGK